MRVWLTRDSRRGNLMSHIDVWTLKPERYCTGEGVSWGDDSGDEQWAENHTEEKCNAVFSACPMSDRECIEVRATGWERV